MSKITVIHRDAELLDEISRLESYLKDELNAKVVEYSQKESRYIHLYAKPNSPVLGKRLGKKFKVIKELIDDLDSETIEKFQTSGSLQLNDTLFGKDDILVFREAMEGTNAISDRFISIDMDCSLNEELISEGLAREVVNRIQKSRKDSGFNVSDRVNVTVNSNARLLKSISLHQEYIKRETLTVNLKISEKPEDIKFDIDGQDMSLTIKPA